VYRGASWGTFGLGLALLFYGLQNYWTKHDGALLSILAWPASFLMVGALLALQWGFHSSTYTACGCDHCGACKHGWCCGQCSCAPPDARDR
jgi:hypothetical protein